ncbi:MAG: hypothetical protein DRJ59_07590 [Thermoprotei archaeon]|nr:MAG: hypothetical protein DRJ59_07590 [Thermoprotei archaeon]
MKRIANADKVTSESGVRIQVLKTLEFLRDFCGTSVLRSLSLSVLSDFDILGKKLNVQSLIPLEQSVSSCPPNQEILMREEGRYSIKIARSILRFLKGRKYFFYGIRLDFNAMFPERFAEIHLSKLKDETHTKWVFSAESKLAEYISATIGPLPAGLKRDFSLKILEGELREDIVDVRGLELARLLSINSSRGYLSYELTVSRAWIFPIALSLRLTLLESKSPIKVVLENGEAYGPDEETRVIYFLPDLRTGFED